MATVHNEYKVQTVRSDPQDEVQWEWLPVVDSLEVVDLRKTLDITLSLSTRHNGITTLLKRKMYNRSYLVYRCALKFLSLSCQEVVLRVLVEITDGVFRTGKFRAGPLTCEFNRSVRHQSWVDVPMWIGFSFDHLHQK